MSNEKRVADRIRPDGIDPRRVLEGCCESCQRLACDGGVEVFGVLEGKCLACPLVTCSCEGGECVVGEWSILVDRVESGAVARALRTAEQHYQVSDGACRECGMGDRDLGHRDGFVLIVIPVVVLFHRRLPLRSEEHTSE